MAANVRAKCFRGEAPGSLRLLLMVRNHFLQKAIHDWDFMLVGERPSAWEQQKQFTCRSANVGMSDAHM